ncbi:hypothetical protein CRENBAI_001170 [Crenichthys baileyi]|uniref:Uncharacterized protein n=1 Tax=Crenichthys baileyi TaxID=28760 RepID=A0AAV9RHD4_9TELE
MQGMPVTQHCRTQTLVNPVAKCLYKPLAARAPSPGEETPQPGIDLPRNSEEPSERGHSAMTTGCVVGRCCFAAAFNEVLIRRCLKGAEDQCRDARLLTLLVRPGSSSSSLP